MSAFAAVTIACWYYTALRQPDDPVGALRAPCAKTAARVSLAPALAERLRLQYRDHPHWSYQLHYDNLAALGKGRSLSSGRCALIPPSSATCRLTAWLRRPRLGPADALAKRVRKRDVRRERSAAMKLTYVGSLWHLDFHHGSLKVLTSGGQWQRPIALGILDDHSRLCCHVQWYLSETAEDLVHGLSQAIQKRGLPRALLTDNGSAMVAEEVDRGTVAPGHRPRANAAVQPLSKREAGGRSGERSKGG